MISDKKSVQHLHKMCLDCGLVDWVISPGSRNAPITITIGNDDRFNAIPVVDERSAAFIAVGNALKKGVASVITCTSGSASLNYAPAIAEAYYQEIPLLVVTADRPKKWIGQGEGQSIDQVNVYENYCLDSFHLNEDDDEAYMKETMLQVSKSLFGERKGPVHLNLAFEEPLYNVEEEGLSIEVNFKMQDNQSRFWDADRLSEVFANKERILILIGQHERDENVDYLLSELSNDGRVVVMTETNSNVTHPHFVNCIDRTLPPVADDKFHPDLVITIGGAIVSKRIKKYLRSIDNLKHWHVAESGVFPNVFEKLTEEVHCHPNAFFRAVNKNISTDVDADFQLAWRQRSLVNKGLHTAHMSQVRWSDLKVHERVHEWLPDGSVLHQGNSSVVRYYQLFDPIKSVTYLSNRGVSGIDGIMSTSVGYAMSSDKLNVLVIGDLSFNYDINAFWNEIEKDNLLVILVNNGGGGIFRIIDGPSSSGLMEKFFEVGNKSKVSYLAKAFGVQYCQVKSEDELDQALEKSVIDFSKGAFKGGIIEVDTSEVSSELVLKEYFTKVNPQ